MRKYSNVLAVLVLLLGLPAWAEEISPAGRQLAQSLDSMNVEQLWLAGKPIKWKTGEPIGDSPPIKGHTHCSAFAAEACRRLGVYLLRPPDHSTVLLANAQYDWLFKSGKEQGWTQLRDGYRAQHFANEGYVVVAVFKESDPKHPGHIAIIRPSTKTPEKIAMEGPQVTQAGYQNYRSTSLREGFKHHPDAWGKQRVRYFVHKLTLTSAT
jgi:hypothetical protein